MNANSIFSKKKRRKIFNLAYAENPDIIVIAESKLNETKKNGEISPKGFCVASRQDRKTSELGGGIVIFTKIGLSYTKSESWHISRETQVTKTKIGDTVILALYTNPQRKYEDDVEILKIMKKFHKENCIFIGDYNLPEISPQEWEKLSLKSEKITGKKGNVKRSNLYIDFCLNFSFLQHVSTQTQISGNSLDLIFSNCEKVDKIDVTQLSYSDHYRISARIRLSEKVKKIYRTFDDFNRADFKKYRNLLKKRDLLNTLKWETDCVDKINAEFDRVVLKAWELSVPKKTVCVNDGSVQNPEITNLVNLLKRQRKKKNKKSALETSRQLSLAIEFETNLEEKRFIKSCQGDTKKFFHEIKKLNSDLGFSSMVKDPETGKECYSDVDRADAFNKAFCSVFHKRRHPKKHLWCRKKVKGKLVDIELTEKKVMAAFTKFKGGKSPGCDGISATMLHQAKYILAPVLMKLYRKCLDDGKYPLIWSKSVVSPIPKKATSDGNPLNFRPISMQCLKFKAFETLIRDPFIEFLEKNGFWAKNQFGFVKGLSCSINLVDFWFRVTQNLNKGEGMTIIYLDFLKCFDTIDIDIFLTKLKEENIDGKIGEFLENWATNRLQSVRINDYYSSCLPCTSGQPQGSCFSPTGFNFMVNDICKKLEDCTIWFADDAKMFWNCKNEEEAAKLQSFLNTLYLWTLENKLKFSIKKCFVIKIGKKQSERKYYLGHEEIQECNETVDLGITVSKNGQFNEHVSKKAKKCSQLAGIFLRNFKMRDFKCAKLFYQSLLQSSMLYGCEAWWQGSDKIMHLTGNMYKNFWMRAKGFVPRGQILSPEQYSRKMDLKLAYKILNGVTKGALRDKLLTTTSKTRGGEKTDLAYPSYKIENNLFQDNFFIRVVRDYNRLSKAERESDFAQFSVSAEQLIKRTTRLLRPHKEFAQGRLKFTNTKKRKKKL